MAIKTHHLSRITHCSVKVFCAFSLVELLVVLSILTMVSSVVLANHSRFNGTVLLGSLAYDIALSVRQAQVYGLSVRQYSDDFHVGYGVHFSDASSYIFFVDRNINQQYDEGEDSIVQTYTVGRGHIIQSFCGVTANGTERCSDSETPITHLDVVFLRPDPDAVMSSNEPGMLSQGIITVAAPSGDTRSIVVASTGQISVQNP
ncbi:MAG: prepilin-type N-terminal cleavage/methylation domain-containing protein [Patescibacteria group bacterium]